MSRTPDLRARLLRARRTAAKAVAVDIAAVPVLDRIEREIEALRDDPEMRAQRILQEAGIAWPHPT